MITLYNIRPKGFNVGNEAIAISLRRYLHQIFGSVVNIITIPATSRYESSSYAGLTAKTIFDINQYGDGVIVGGGNLYENGELDVSLDALNALNVPMMLFSLSRGRIYNKQSQLVSRTDAMPDKILQALHQKACVSLARDTTTTEYLRSIGCDNASLGGCPTIFLNHIAHRLPSLPETDSGAFISVRNPQLMSIPPADQARVHSDITQMISTLQNAGYDKVRILCHDHRDVSFAASFPQVDYVYTDDVYEYLALLKNCRLNVAYRLHACLPCISFDRPVIKISYDERAASLMKTLNCDSININMMKNKDVITAFKEKLTNLDPQNLKLSVSERWEEVDGLMQKGLTDFAEQVNIYKASQLS